MMILFAMPRNFLVIQCDENVGLLLTEKFGGIYCFEGEGVHVFVDHSMDIPLLDLPTLHT